MRRLARRRFLLTFSFGAALVAAVFGMPRFFAGPGGASAVVSGFPWPALDPSGLFFQQRFIFANFTANALVAAALEIFLYFSLRSRKHALASIRIFYPNFYFSLIAIVITALVLQHFFVGTPYGHVIDIAFLTSTLMIVFFAIVFFRHSCRRIFFPGKGAGRRRIQRQKFQLTAG